jgi:hypothetical protein
MIKILDHTLRIVRWPLFWIAVGVSCDIALIPGWSGLYGNSVWWIHLSVWVASLVVVLAITKGALNYINDRNFWTGYKRDVDSKHPVNELLRGEDAARVEMAFWRWAERSQIRIEMLSSEHRKILHEEVLNSIAKAAPEDFFHDERSEIEKLLIDSRQSLGQINKIKENLGSMLTDVARREIVECALKDVRGKINEDAVTRLQLIIDDAQNRIDLLLARVDHIIAEKISSAMTESSIDRRLARPISENFGEICADLYRFLAQHTRRANVYLYIGIFIGLTSVLMFSVYFFSVMTHPDIWMLLTRAGLLIAFEAFAVFFLRLYKTALADVSFFQSEISAIKSKQAGIDIATHIAAQHDYKPLIDAVSALALLDRNAVIKKDYTTKNLEEKRLSSQEELELIKAIAELVKASRGK